VPSNQFFKSRYDWDENELGVEKGSTKQKIKVSMADEDDDGEARKLPLKKPAAKSNPLRK
jgi:hypothetical protein